MKTMLENIQFRKFAPIDREHAIFELVHEDTVLLDVGATDAGEFQVAIHEGAVNKLFALDELLELLQEGRKLVEEDMI